MLLVTAADDLLDPAPQSLRRDSQLAEDGDRRVMLVPLVDQSSQSVVYDIPGLTGTVVSERLLRLEKVLRRCVPVC
jgi:hypothetical protein